MSFIRCDRGQTPADHHTLGLALGPANRYIHSAYQVSDIDAVADDLKAKGVAFTRDPTTVRPGVRICFIRGPEGISIELLDRDPKYGKAG